MLRILKLFNKIDKFLIIISSLALFVMMVWVFTDVALRGLFNYPIEGTVDITGEYFMVFIVYLSISYTQKNKKHVNVSFIESRFPRWFKNIVNIIKNLIAAIFFFYISYLHIFSTIDYFSQGKRSNGVLDYPLWPALLVITIGLLMITLRLIIEIFLVNREEYF